jgi:Zn finger protein HypA/HybF involved in hydrogenase expression
MRLFLAALIIGLLLAAYVMIEKRVSQRSCPACGYKVSVDGPDEDCPRCQSLIPARES